MSGRLSFSWILFFGYYFKMHQITHTYLLCWQLCQWVPIMPLRTNYWYFFLILSSQQDVINIWAESTRIILCQFWQLRNSAGERSSIWQTTTTLFADNVCFKNSQFALLTKLSLFVDAENEILKSGVIQLPELLVKGAFDRGQLEKGDKCLQKLPPT